MELINTFKISLDRLGPEDVQLVHRNETEETEMMTYGLTQKLIKRTRERFNSGELTYEEAMWFLGLMYSDNKNNYFGV